MPENKLYIIESNKIKISIDKDEAVIRDNFIIIKLLEEIDKDETIDNFKKEIKGRLRDIALDILDVMNSYECYLPLIFIIHSENKDFWLKLSGDQDWHRGEFYIMVDNEKGEKKELLLNPLKSSIIYEPKIVSKEKIKIFLEQNKDKISNTYNGKTKEYYEYLIDLAIKNVDKDDINYINEWKNKIETDLKNLFDEVGFGE